MPRCDSLNRAYSSDLFYNVLQSRITPVELLASHTLKSLMWRVQCVCTAHAVAPDMAKIIGLQPYLTFNNEHVGVWLQLSEL